MAENNKFRIKATTSDGRNVTVEADKFARDYDAYVSENPGARITMYDVDGKEQSVDIAKAKSMYGKGYSYTPNQSNHHAGKIRYDRSHPKVESAKKEEDASPSSVSQKAQQLVKPKTDGGIGVEVADVTAPKVEIPDVSAEQTQQSYAIPEAKSQNTGMSEKERAKYIINAGAIADDANARLAGQSKEMKSMIDNAGNFNVYGGTGKSGSVGSAIGDAVARKADESMTKAYNSYVPDAMKEVDGVVNGSVDDVMSQLMKESVDDFSETYKPMGNQWDFYAANLQMAKSANKVQSLDNINSRVGDINMTAIGNKVLLDSNGGYAKWVIDGANKAGVDEETYIRRVVTPAIRNKFAERLSKIDTDRNKVNSYADYLAKKFTGMTDMATMTKNDYLRRQQSLAEYESGLSGVTGFLAKTGGVVSSVMGDPSVYIGGIAGNLALKGTTAGLRWAGNVAARKAATTAIEKTVTKAILSKIATVAPKFANVLMPTFSGTSSRASAQYAKTLLANLSKPSWYGTQMARGIVSGVPNFMAMEGSKAAYTQACIGDDNSGYAILNALWNGATVDGEKYGGGAEHGAELGLLMSFVTPIGGLLKKGASRPISQFGATMVGKGAEVGLFMGLEYNDYMKEGRYWNFTDSFLRNAQMIIGMHYGMKIMGNPMAFLESSKKMLHAGWDKFKHPIDAYNDAIRRDRTGDSKWTNEEREWLKQNYPDMTTFEIADIIDEKALTERAIKGDSKALDTILAYENMFDDMFSRPDMPWTLKQKIGGECFETIEPSRPLFSHYKLDGDNIMIYDGSNSLIEIRNAKTQEDINDIIAEQKIYAEHAKVANMYAQLALKGTDVQQKDASSALAVAASELGREKPLKSVVKNLPSAFADIASVPYRAAKGTLKENPMAFTDDVSKREVVKLLSFDPMKLSEGERRILSDFGEKLRYIIEEDRYDSGVLDTEGSIESGHHDADMANPLGEESHPEYAKNVSDAYMKAMDDYNASQENLYSSDVYRTISDADNQSIISNYIDRFNDSEIPDALRNDGYTVLGDAYEEYVKLKNDFEASSNRYSNAIARYNAFIEGTNAKIEEAIDTYWYGIKHNGTIVDGNGLKSYSSFTCVRVSDGETEYFLRDGDIDGDKISSASGMVIVVDKNGNIEYKNAEELSIISASDKENEVSGIRQYIQEQITAEYGLGQQGGGETKAPEQTEVLKDGTETEENLQVPEENSTFAGETEQVVEIPTDKKGNKLYTEVPPEVTLADFESRLKGDKALAEKAVNRKVADAKKEVDAIAKKLEKEDDLDKLEALQNDAVAAQKTLDYWNSVKALIDARKAEEARLEAERVAKLENDSYEKTKAEYDFASLVTIQDWENAVKNAEQKVAQAELQYDTDVAATAKGELRAINEAFESFKETLKGIDPELQGIPDFSIDKASDARERGFRVQNGVKVERQEPVEGVDGKEVSIIFSDEDTAKGVLSVVDAKSVQPSHLSGQRNVLFFINEAQPKDRTDAVSEAASDKIAQNVNTDLVGENPTAYLGAPVINSRGEVIQGNNRAVGLKKMQNIPEQKAKYKQWLMDNAEKFGMKKEDIEKMENPMLVRKLDVSDEEAIRLGQFDDKSITTGGESRIEAKKVFGKAAPEHIDWIMRNLFSTGSDGSDMTVGQLIDRNGITILKYMRDKKLISESEYNSAFNKNGTGLSSEGKNDIRKIMLHNILDGGVDDIEKMFERLPNSAQTALIQAMAGDGRLPKDSRLVKNVQNAIVAASEIEAYFANNKDAKKPSSVEEWADIFSAMSKSRDMYDTSKPFNERYSALDLKIASILLSEKQSVIKNIFAEYQKLILGNGGTFFEKAEKLDRAEAIERIFNIKENNNDGKREIGIALAGGREGEIPGREGEEGLGEYIGRVSGEFASEEDAVRGYYYNVLGEEKYLELDKLFGDAEPITDKNAKAVADAVTGMLKGISVDDAGKLFKAFAGGRSASNAILPFLDAVAEKAKGMKESADSFKRSSVLEQNKDKISGILASGDADTPEINDFINNEAKNISMCLAKESRTTTTIYLGLDSYEKKYNEELQKAEKKANNTSLSAEEQKAARREVAKWRACIELLNSERENRRDRLSEVKKKFNIKPNSVLDDKDVVRFFYALTNNAETIELFEKVQPVIEKLGLKYNSIISKIHADGDSSTDGTIRYSVDRLVEGQNDAEEVAATILHEKIHQVQQYLELACSGRAEKILSSPRYTDRLKENIKKYIASVTPEQKEAWNEIESIYKACLERDDLFLGDFQVRGKGRSYAMTNVGEFIAEMSKPKHREELKKCGLWEKMVRGVLKLFGVEPKKGKYAGTAYDRMYAAFDKLLNSFDENTWRNRKALSEPGSGANKASRLDYLENLSKEKIGGKRKNEMDSQLVKKRPDMSEQQRKETIDEIEKLGEKVKAGGDPKTEKLAHHWVLKGNLILPEDEYKLLDAIDVAKKKGIDPFSYDNPTQLLMENSDVKPSARKTDPDTVNVFSNKKELLNGVVVYDVEDSKEGQKAVRQIIDEHWGEDANPWCLAARHGSNDTELTDAWNMWNHYNAKQKKIAFKDGKLLAFHATDDKGKIEWWNRVDEPSEGFEINSKREDGMTEHRIMNDNGKVGEVTKLSKGNENDGVYDEWDVTGRHTMHQEKKDGKLVNLVEYDTTMEDFPVFRVRNYDDKGRYSSYYQWDVEEDGSRVYGTRWDEDNGIRYSFNDTGECDFMNQFIGTADGCDICHKAFLMDDGRGIVDIGNGLGRNLRLVFDANGKLSYITSSWHVNGHTAKETCTPDEVSFGGLKNHAFGSSLGEKLIKGYLSGEIDFNDALRIFDKETDAYRDIIKKYPESEWTKTDNNSYKAQIEESGLAEDMLDDLFFGRGGANEAKRAMTKAINGDKLEDIERIALTEAIKEKKANDDFISDLLIFGVTKSDVINTYPTMDEEANTALHAFDKFKDGKMLSRDERKLLNDVLESKNNNYINDTSSHISKVNSNNDIEESFTKISSDKISDDDRNDSINRVINKIKDGEARLTKLPEGVERNEGRRTVAQIAGRVISNSWMREFERSSRETGEESELLGADNSQVSREGLQRIEDAIESYARENGFWLEESEYEAKYGEDVKSGAEARVYIIGDKVVKFVSPNKFHKQYGVSEYFDRICILNSIDDYSSHNVIGYARDKDGTFRVVVEQNKLDKTFDVEFDSEFNHVSEESKENERVYFSEIVPKLIEKFTKLGFDCPLNDGDVIANDDFFIKDIYSGNVGIDKNGEPHIIDAIAKYAKRESLGEFGISETESETSSRTSNDVNKSETESPINSDAVSRREKSFNDAIAKGDKALARINLKGIAELNGYGYEGWHGSPNVDITEFVDGKRGWRPEHSWDEVAEAGWFTDSEEGSKRYGGGKYGGRSYHVFIRMKKPLHIYGNSELVGDAINKWNDAKSARDKALEDNGFLNGKQRQTFKDAKQEFDDVYNGNEPLSKLRKMCEEAMKEYPESKTIGEAFREKLKAHGYDGVVMHDTAADGAKGETWYLPTDAGNNIKSADLITKDDNGNVIPIEERFSDSKDIRYKTSKYDSEVSRTFDETQPLRAEAHDVINSLGGKGKVFGSADELDAEGKRALKENSRAMGWYNQKTGEVCVYLPNCRSRYDVQRVVQHEKVGHEGLRGLMGQEGYKKFMQKIWMGLDAETRKELIDKHGMNYLLCTDEYLAEKAETFNDADRSFWQKVKDTWNDVMRSLGFKQSSTEDDIRTALWLSKNRLENKTGNIEYKIRKAAFEAKLKKYKPSDFISKDGRTFADSQAKEFDMKEFIFSSRMTDEDREKVMREYTLKGKSDIRRYNDRLQAFSYAWGEAHGDRLKAARILLEVVTGKTGNDIPEEYNIVNKLEALASVNRQAQEAFAREQLDPLCKTIDNLQRHFDGNNARERYENLEMYAYIKHALERNRVFAVRDFCKKLYDSDDAADTALADTIIKDFNDVRNTARADLDAGNITLSDYYNRLDTFIGGHIDGYDAGKADRSGLSDFDAEELNKLGIPTGTKGEYNDAVAIDHIMDCETKMGADNAKELWDKINAISSSNVKREYEAGNIDKQTREKLDGMFHWYLPLRGFNAESAEDVYGYIHRNIGTRLSTEVKANGRNSLAKTPISTLAAMADFSIMNCNRNLVKQSLVRLARHSKSNLISEYDVWYHKVVKGGVETLEATYPELREDMTPAEVEQAIEQHEADIQQNIANGETYVKLKDEKTNSPYRIVSSKDKEQHFVSCNINGKRVTVIVHGNPRAAQAVNGMVHDKSWKGWSNINRFMSQMMTSYSWTFMMRNAARDLEYASASGFIADFNKGEKWNRDFWSVYGSLATTVNATGVAGNRLDGKMSGMLNLFKRYREGKLDVANNEVDKYFKEFVEGGGMTGYTQLHTVEDYAKNINNTISGGFNRFKNSKNKFVKYGTMSAEALLKAPKMIIDMAETANEAVENHARFAAYCASRMEHRSVSRSIHDAKEISVNFNRTGAGSGTLSLRTENESWLWKANKNVAALSANFMRNAMWFYNPAVQGMSRNVDLFWKGDAKQKARFMFAQVVVPAALMSLMAYSSAVVASYDTDDEKKKYGENPLDQLPDFVRRDNMCLYVGHGRFVMMPLAIELRAAYGMADVLDRMRRGLPSEKGYMWEFYEQLTQLTPMDLGGGGKVAWNSGWGSALGTITPSNLQPIIACMTNVKWTGSPVSGRNSYNASKAEWQRTMSTTNPMYVDVARELSIMSGDDIIGDKEGVSGGHIDINPDIAQYLVESYTGGPGKELGEIMGLLSDDIDLTKLPIAKAFSRSARPENSMAVTRSRWYRYAEAYKSETKPWLAGFKKFGETAEYRALMDSPKGKIGNVVKHYEKSIQREQERKNKTSNLNEKKLHQERLNSLICEAIEQIDRIENSK